MQSPTSLHALVRKPSAASVSAALAGAATKPLNQIDTHTRLTLKTLTYQAVHAMRNPRTASLDNVARLLSSLLISRELAAGGRHHEHAAVIAAGITAASTSLQRTARHAAAGALTRAEHGAVMAALSALEQQLDDKTLTDVEFGLARDRAEASAISHPITTC